MRTDFGSCTIALILPCIRYTFTPVAPAGAGTAGVVRYRGALGTEPSPSRPKEQVVRTFENLDAATARIDAFDAAFPPLVPRAVGALVEALEREGRR